MQTSDYASGRRGSRVVQQEVKGEADSADHGYYATGYPLAPTQPAPPPEAPATSTEAPFTDPGEAAEDINQGRVVPPPTTEVRRFSAPHMEWDATRSVRMPVVVFNDADYHAVPLHPQSRNQKQLIFRREHTSSVLIQHLIGRHLLNHSYLKTYSTTFRNQNRRS